MNANDPIQLPPPDSTSLPSDGVHPDEDSLNLYALFQSEVAAEECSRIEAHLCTCSPCREHMQTLRAKRVEAANFLASEEGEQLSRKLRSRLATTLTAFEAPSLVSALPDGGWIVAKAASPRGEADLRRLLSPTPTAAQEEVSSFSRAGRWDVEPHLDLFYPDGMLHDTIKQRLAEQTLAKVALGRVCLDILMELPPQSLFIESGSTPALAFQGIIQNWRAGGTLPRWISPKTNNFLLHQAIWATAGISSRLLYGNKYYNPKYAGCFPVSENILNRAFEGKGKAKYLVAKAWDKLIAEAKGFDALFMTASKFHFFAGAFVGSKDNALLKAAFFSACGSRLVLLLDGSKLILTNGLRAELEGCIPVIDSAAHPNADRPFRAIFPQQPVSEELLALRFEAAQRNPCVKLNLRQCFIRYKTKNKGVRCEEVDTPWSWASCVERFLQRKGELWICISEPYPPPLGTSFAEYLDQAVKEGNACFKRFGSKVRIGAPVPVVVGVNPQTFSLDAHGSEAVTVWKCPMILLGGPADLTSAEPNSRPAVR